MEFENSSAKTRPGCVHTFFLLQKVLKLLIFAKVPKVIAKIKSITFQMFFVFTYESSRPGRAGEIFGFGDRNWYFYKYVLMFEIVFKLYELHILYTENALQTEISTFLAH